MGGGGLILILNGTNMEVQYPILDAKELEAIDRLSNRYQKLVEPNQIMKIGNELGKFVPKELKLSKSYIAINLGQEAVILTIDGWEKKKYDSNKEIREIILSDKVGVILYKNSFHIIDI